MWDQLYMQDKPKRYESNELGSLLREIEGGRLVLNRVVAEIKYVLTHPPLLYSPSYYSNVLNEHVQFIHELSDRIDEIEGKKTESGLPNLKIR